MEDEQEIQRKKLKALEYHQQEQFRNWPGFIEQILSYYPDFSLKGKTCLDIGCGTGGLARNLIKYGASKVICIDIDEILLQKATEESKEYPTIEFHKADFKDGLIMIVKNEKFDLVTSTFSIGYFGDLGNAFKKLASYVKLNGILAVEEVNGLFSSHNPLRNKEWFLKFDRDGLYNVGYDAFAGRQLKISCEIVLNLGDIHEFDREDQELNFCGPASDACIEAWKRRWIRLWPLLTEFGGKDFDCRDSFFECLLNSSHTCEGACKVVVARKISADEEVELPKRLRSGSGSLRKKEDYDEYD